MEDVDYSGLSKAQRKKLKKQRKELGKERERAERLRKQRIRKIRRYGIMLLIILAIAGYFYWKSLPVKNAPIININPKDYNFGTVSQAEGIVIGYVQISNIGESDLILKDMETSCMCTTASIIDKEGKEGPKFGMKMHGTNPTNWREVIPPQESLKLKIYYDPNVHKELLGPVTRVISIYSNDPKQKKIDIITKLNQVK